MQAICAFALHRIRIMTADQLHQFLRVHLVAVRIIRMLLRHRAMAAAVGNRIFFLRKFGRYRADV